MKGWLLAPKMLFATVVLVAFSACVSLVGITYAYFVSQVSAQAEYDVATMSAKVYESTLSGSSVLVGSEYTSSSTIAAGSSKTLTIQNKSQFKSANAVLNKVLLRVSFSVKVGNAQTTDYNITLVNNSTYSTVSGQTNAGFTAIENGYYYYNAPLATDGYAPFATFQNTGSSAMHVALNIEVVQASLDVAENYWNYYNGLDQSSKVLSGTKTVDGNTITNSNGIVVLIPNNAGWKQAISSDSLDTPYTSGASTLNIPALTGTSGNNCMRVYNNSQTPIILALRMHVSLYEGAVSSNEWSAIGSFANVEITFNFANDTNSHWLDIRDNADPRKFNVDSNGKYISFLYDTIVKPGESVYALSKEITVTNPVTTSGNFKFRIICEVLGYDASESDLVDDYLAITETHQDAGSIVTGDRVPLYYAYTTTDSTSNVYTTQLDSNGQFIDRADYYSQYAKWFNTISSSLT